MSQDATTRTTAADLALADTAHGDAAHGDAAEPGRVPTRAPHPTRAPQRLGRYLVLESIGEGGMGQVFRAFDPKLDRAVAIKLLHPSADPLDHGRLLREAQAMAKLSHPHVVPVFDVGTVDARVFVAMDFVRGPTLRRWLRTGPRPWQAVVQMFVQAGRGLAAAHAVGLVHRDFKPDNVLVGTLAGGGERAQVLDFGLAKPLEGGPSEAVDSTLVSASGTDLRIDDAAGDDALPSAERLTRTGQIMGTPAYMAPEQFVGLPVDARTDQFAFCIALYEALYGERPFAGSGPRALAMSVVRNQRRPLPTRPVLPKRLVRACLRGLARDPQARYPTMEALLHELEALLQRRRARWSIAGGGVLVGSVAAAIVVGTRPPAPAPPLCQGAAAQLEGVWDAARQGALDDAIATASTDQAREALGGARPLLDTYAHAWVAAHAQACEATRVLGTQSEALLDRRMTCLERRRQRLRAAVDVVVGGAAPVQAHAVEVAAGLPELDACADVEALSAEVAPPDDPAARTEVEAIQIALADAAALLDAGQHAAQVESLRALRQRAEALGYPPVQADVTRALGQALSLGSDLDAADEAYQACSFAAVASRYDAAAIDCTEQLAFVHGYQRSDRDTGLRWIRLAEAFAERRPSDAVQAGLLLTRGQLEIAAGRRAEAKVHLEHALERGAAARGAEHFRQAEIHNGLGVVGLLDGDYAQAHDHLAAALRIREAHEGPHNPGVAQLLVNLGLTLERQGRYDEAVPRLERAYAVLEAALGPDDATVGQTLQNLGYMLYQRGDHDAARARLEQARDVIGRALGPEHPAVAPAYTVLGDVARAQGRLTDARAAYQRSYEIRVAVHGAAHPSLLLPLTGLGEVALAEGDLDGAVAALERAVACVGDQAVDPGDMALTRFALARARWQQGRADDARTQASAAEAGFTTAGANARRHRDALAKWRADTLDRRP
jgi:tetratricopeptide (TPR) repeat protein